MSNESHPLSEDMRKVIYDDLAEVHIQTVANGISKQERENVSRYVLQLDKVKTYGELIVFLRQLADAWEAYRGVYEKYKRLGNVIS